MNQHTIPSLWYEANEVSEENSLSWVNLIPPTPSIDPPQRGRCARWMESIRRRLGYRYQYTTAVYDPLDINLVAGLRVFISYTDYQRVRSEWDSLWMGMAMRSIPTRRPAMGLEQGSLSRGNLCYHNLLFYQLAGEGVEAEKEAISGFEYLFALNRPATRPATPWIDALATISTDQPGMSLDEIVREIQLFGNRCHFYLTRRTPQDYEDDPSLNREESRNGVVLRDSWQLIAQHRWTELAERFSVDIQWLERVQIFRSTEEQHHNRLAIHRLTDMRDTIFDQIEERRIGRGTAITSVTVNSNWLPAFQNRHSIIRMVIPQ